MLVNYSDTYGLLAVDVSTGAKVGEVRTFSTTYKSVIKGLLVKKPNEDVVLIEPGRILGVGSAAAVIDLDENAPIVSLDDIENSSIIGRPAISIGGDPAGTLINCVIDLKTMEINEVRLLSPDQKTEYTIGPGQVRTLGRDFIILGSVEPKTTADRTEPWVMEVKEAAPIPAVKAKPEKKAVEEEPRVLFMNFEPDEDVKVELKTETVVEEPVVEVIQVVETKPEPIVVEPEPVPVVKVVHEPVVEAVPAPVAEVVPAPVVETVPEPVAEVVPEPVVEAVPEPVVVEVVPEPEPEPEPEPVVEEVKVFNLADWQDQIDALVNKSMGRTMAVDSGGEQKTLEAGTIITREIAEDIAVNAPFFLEVLPLFVR